MKKPDDRARAMIAQHLESRAPLLKAMERCTDDTTRHFLGMILQRVDQKIESCQTGEIANDECVRTNAPTLPKFLRACLGLVGGRQPASRP